MKTIIALVLVTAMAVAVDASPVIKNYYTVVVDENGHGFLTESIGNQIVNVQTLPAATDVADPFAVAHPDNPSTPNPLTLSYALPSFLTSRLATGDIIVNEPGGASGQGQPSDLIRISSNGRLYTYSDLDDAGSGLGQSLADVGIPLNIQSVVTTLTEGSLNDLDTLGMRLPSSAVGCHYLPTVGRVGCYTNGIINFYMISDGKTPPAPAIPEPSTVIAGVLMLVPFGVAMVRKCVKA